jgi:hypothetical protein
VCASRGNLQARSDMMMSSMMGAIAFQKDLGAVHSCAHALGAVCDLHHGLANALMIDTVLAWNQSAVPAKFDELAHVCGVAGGGKAFVPWLRSLKASVGITGGLAAHGVKPEHLPRLVRDRHRRHLPPDQPAALHRADFERCSRRRCDAESAAPSTPPAMRSRLKIGVSACFLHPDPARRVAPKTLQYVEQSVPHWVMSAGRAAGDDSLAHRRHRPWRRHFADYAQWLDGLVLHGGAMCGPAATARTPLQERWNGDRMRDEYEIALVRAFVPAGKPVFGICRGLQLINVAFGGTLYQDIATQRPGAGAPRRGAYDLQLP